MWKLIEHLRKKPRIVRQQVAIIVSGLLSVLVFFSWWGSWTASENTPAATERAQSPVTVVFDTVADLANRSKSLWGVTLSQMQYDAEAEVAASAHAISELDEARDHAFEEESTVDMATN
jgi:hypothetical protein